LGIPGFDDMIEVLVEAIIDEDKISERLRSLYLLLAGMMEKFYYLKLGLVMILFFVGSKMIVSEFFEIPIVISLMVIFGILAAALLLSFIRTGQQQQAKVVIDK
jgi:predicted tellurium resistance membrane protein TerC